MEAKLDTRPHKGDVCIVDTTLRDGEQAPGVVFSLSDKLAIARRLDRLGIDELEVGTPAMGPQVREDIRQITALGLRCRLSVWCRARKEDLAAALRCNVDSVHISLPVSSIQLDALDRDEAWALERIERLVPMACRNFERVTVGAQDATRADDAFLHRFAVRTGAAGADRLRLADTVGIGSPSTISKLVNDLRQTVPCLALEFHGHNDLGMATANAITALEAGAHAVSVTVNGLGERAGNSTLEQVAVALHQHAFLKSKIQLAGLLSLCKLVARAANMPIGPTQPVVGDRVFAHESGIHCHAMIKDRRTYAPFAPHTVGHAGHRFILGTHSGTALLSDLLRKAGINVSKRQARTLKPLLLESLIYNVFK